MRGHLLRGRRKRKLWGRGRNRGRRKLEGRGRRTGTRMGRVGTSSR